MSIEASPSISQQAWPPGFAVRPSVCGVSDELVAAFRSVPVAHASDCLGRAVGATGLHSYHQDMRLGLCGAAVTVRVRPGDNLMIHMAMLMANPGDVIAFQPGKSPDFFPLSGLTQKRKTWCGRPTRLAGLM